MKDLIAVGYLSMDYIVHIEQPIRESKTSIIHSKESLVPSVGGCHVNVCTILSKLGKNVLPIVRVGSDHQDLGLLDFFKLHNLRLEGVTVVENEKTPYSLLIETSTHNHYTLYYPGSMNEKYFSPINHNVFENTRYALMTVASIKDNKDFLKQCKKHNLPLIFGMKMDEDAFPKAFLYDILSYAKVIFMNESESLDLIKMFNLNDISDLFKHENLKTLVITKGKKGSVVYDNTADKVNVFQVGIAEVEHIVDTSGSGDAYIAGFLYAYLNDEPIKECGKYGAAASAFIIEGKGCTSNIPTIEMLQNRLMTGGLR